MELRPGLKDIRRPPTLMYAYVALNLLVGVRTEEARALRWQHVNLDGDLDAKPPVPPHVAIWRSARVHGETKSERSRRTLGLPQMAIEALRAPRESQAEERALADERWQDSGLVFTTHHGNAPRRGKRPEDVQARTQDTWPVMPPLGRSEVVYRRELRQVITTGAEIMDEVFGLVLESR